MLLRYPHESAGPGVGEALPREEKKSLLLLDIHRAKAGAVYAGMSPLVAGDIADLALFAITRPLHVNVNRIEVMPVDQAFSPFAVHRTQAPKSGA